MEINVENNVAVLPVKFKEPPGEDAPFFVVEHMGKCSHFGPFIVNDKEDAVTCKQCGERLNPMYVLKRLAHEETRWHQARVAYQDEMQRLKERSRTKCDHCGEMTRISKR